MMSKLLFLGGFLGSSLLRWLLFDSFFLLCLLGGCLLGSRLLFLFDDFVLFVRVLLELLGDPLRFVFELLFRELLDDACESSAFEFLRWLLFCRSFSSWNLFCISRNSFLCSWFLFYRLVGRRGSFIITEVLHAQSDLPVLRVEQDDLGLHDLSDPYDFVRILDRLL